MATQVAAAQDARNTVERPVGVPFETLARNAGEAWAAGRTEDALASFRAGLELEQAARLLPDSAEVYLALAQAYAAAGRTADVEKARARLLEIDRRRGSTP